MLMCMNAAAALMLTRLVVREFKEWCGKKKKPTSINTFNDTDFYEEKVYGVY